jgi:hypothetical protein
MRENGNSQNWGRAASGGAPAKHRRPVLAVSTLSVLLLTAASNDPARAQVHWCDSPTHQTYVENLICNDVKPAGQKNLREKDDLMVALFKQLGGWSSGSTALKNTQKQFIQTRNNMPSQTQLHVLYQARINNLQSQVNASIGGGGDNPGSGVGPPIGNPGGGVGPPIGNPGSGVGPPIGNPGGGVGPPIGNPGSGVGPPIGNPGSGVGPPIGNPGGGVGPPIGNPGSGVGPPIPISKKAVDLDNPSFSISMYSETNTFSDEVATIPNGTMVLVTVKPQHTDSDARAWNEVVYNGKTGWVLAQFLQ